MSDRVACICGKTEQWDHFPFAVPYDDGFDVTQGGFVSDLDTVMKWYWRVKVWHIEASVDTLSIAGDFDITDSDLNPFADREAGLVAPAGEVFWYINDFGDGGDTQMTVYYETADFLKTPGGFFFPFLVHAWGPDLTVQNRLADLEEGGHAPDADIDDGASLDGALNSVYYFQGVGPALTAEIAITPAEYWPYATSPTAENPDGLPVYDTSTGAQLRDPFS